MRRVVLSFTAFALPLFCQDIFTKAPPAVDEALRERVTIFYQAHVDGKFRQAEEVIAGDSKDVFYNMEKQRYLSFDIARINYSDNYTKAVVVTALELEWRTPRMGKQIVKSPMTSAWRIEDGKWYWYVELNKKSWNTPWGEMKPGPDNPSNVLAALRAADPQAILQAIKTNVSSVEMKSYEPGTGEVQIHNGMPGEIKLTVEPVMLRGLEVSLDKSTLQAKETAKLVLSYKPETKEAKPTQIVNIRVTSTGQTIPIRVTFAVPPEVESAIPRK